MVYMHFYLVPLFIAMLILAVKWVIATKFPKPATTGMDFEKLLLILNVVVSTEVDLYDKTIFRFKGHITNANYENFYNDICSHIFKAIPEAFFEEIGRYLTREAVVEIICQIVQEYLQSKVGAYEKQNNEEEE